MAHTNPVIIVTHKKQTRSNLCIFCFMETLLIDDVNLCRCFPVFGDYDHQLKKFQYRPVTVSPFLPAPAA